MRSRTKSRLAAARVAAELSELQYSIEQSRLEFCVKAAAFANSREYHPAGIAGTLEWISTECHMTAIDAIDTITIGQTIIRALKKRAPG